VIFYPNLQMTFDSALDAARQGVILSRLMSETTKNGFVLLATIAQAPRRKANSRNDLHPRRWPASHCAD
jgi:hypothetical protein